MHRVTGGCEAYTARKQAAKIQLRNRIVVDADAVMRAEGCTRTAGRVRTYGAAGVSSSGHASKGILQEPKRASHLLRGGTGHQGRPEVTVDGSARGACADVPGSSTRSAAPPSDPRASHVARACNWRRARPPRAIR